jgi:hypothetical protein
MRIILIIRITSGENDMNGVAEASGPSVSQASSEAGGTPASSGLQAQFSADMDLASAETGSAQARVQAQQSAKTEHSAPETAAPVRANASTNRVVVTNSDGSQDIRSGGSKSWRDNNPGNMVAGAGGQQPIGYNGKMAIFPNYQSGRDAMVANLQTPRYQALTVAGAIATWAPADDGNDPVAYANAVAGWTEIKPERR